jgi:molybdopterin synthase sulfur carrier subunit
MIQLRYFGRLREQVQTGGEELEFSSELDNVGCLLEHLCKRGETWESALNGQAAVLMAVNQELASTETRLADGDEVAFFPPVTGG